MQQKCGSIWTIRGQSTFFKYRKSFAFLKMYCTFNMVKTANLLFILILKQEKKFPGINLHGNPKICVFTALNFAFNPQNSVPLKYTKINSKKILLLFSCCANKEAFELPLHYTFRHRTGTGGRSSYKYRNYKSILMLVAINLV